MTPQETQLLQDFLAQLSRSQAGSKDPQAQELIARTFAQQPDAAYLVVQRALLLEQGLKQAQARITQIQEQSPSFIGGGPAWSQPPGAAPAVATAPAPAVAAAPAYSPAAQVASRAGGGSAVGSFLGNAAATAAGVAGGAFLFQGLENLFGHGGGGFTGGNVPTEMVENVTVNNYGSDAASADRSADDDEDASADQDFDDPGDDSSWT